MTPLLVAASSAVLLGATVLAVLHPRIILLLLVALDVSYVNAVIAGHVGISPYLPQLFLALVALGVMARRGSFRFAWSPVLVGLLVVYAGFFVSFRAAIDPYNSEILLWARVRDLVFFFVVYALLLSTGKVASVLRAAVLVLAGLAALTVFHEFVLDNAGNLGGLSQVPLTEENGASTPRHAGTHTDVNFWARLLILFTPLSLSMSALSRRTAPRVLWGISTVSLLMGVYLTQSRGGFIALFVALVVWAVLSGSRHRRALLWTSLVLLPVVPLTGVGDRLESLVQFGTESRALADGSLVTRERLQLIAWRMFLDAPATGHGIGSYGSLFATYDRTSDFYNRVSLGAAAHNFFLEQAADGGVVLLLCWAVFLGTVFFALLRTLISARESGDEPSRYLATGIIAGLVGWLVASVFLHLSDYRALLMLAAVAAVLDLGTRRRLEPAPPQPSSSPPRHERLMPRTLLKVSALGAAAAGMLLATAGDRYTSSTTLAVLPTSTEIDWADAYALDVVSRGMIVPTLASVLDESVSTAALEATTDTRPGSTRAEVDIQQSRLGGAVVVTVVADDERTAAELGDAAVHLARSEVAALDSGYRLADAPSTPVERHTTFSWVVAPLTVVAALSAGWVAQRLRRRARSAP
ncbi:O-antigen ligase family protein [Kocuria flava]|uniref:O-antigen ligase family protein n=1 Tax=Kocuria flava TaxID=446860 RepID=UPI001FF3565E|nr:O-antigen ligase family protein [Kocuria flava]MCJ8505910.1 O-antigen ligase family protein [Kocuria flava]